MPLGRNGVNPCEGLTGLDLFGQRVSFSFKKSATYKSGTGACISFFCICLMAAFTFNRAKKLLSRDDPFFSMTTLAADENSVVDLW